MFYSRRTSVESACDVTLFKSLVKALVNIQYLSYLHQDLGFSRSLMEFKDLHSSAELPWKQSSPGWFFPVLPEIRQINGANPPRQRQEHTLSTEKSHRVPVSTEYTQLFLIAADRGSLNSDSSELDWSISVYKRCRNFSSRIDATVTHIYQYTLIHTDTHLLLQLDLLIKPN